MKSNSLAFESLQVAREGVPLTQPITMHVSGGELLVVRGTNGSGKSTLLKTIAGLLPPLGGSIRFNGEALAPYPILYLGHKRGLAPELSVEDNVTLWARLSGASELIGAALHYFDLDDIRDLPIEKLSAGWQQRVALTRLITIPSPLWLLDEPLSNLDAEGISLLQSLIQSRMEQGGIVAMTSHHEMQGERVKELKIKLLEEKVEAV